MTFILISSTHLEGALWFRDEEDFVVGMNYIAVLSIVTGINILAFILMSNHVHFVLECSLEEAKIFFDKLKRLYGAYYQRKYGKNEPLRRNSADYRELKLSKESVERAIAYVLMNCVAANICSTAYGYPWSSAGCIFNLNKLEGKPIGSYSTRKQWRILKSRTPLPSDFILGNQGFIIPDSYIQKDFVESLFRTPKRFNFMMQNSSKAKLRIEKAAAPSFTDQIVFAAASDLCHSFYRKASLKEINTEEKSDLIRQIKYRFSAEPAQLSRIFEMPYSEICAIIDSY